MRARSMIAFVCIPATLGLVMAITPTASAAPAKNPGDCTIIGTSGPDVLKGTPADDVICGLAGDDVIRGLGGDDILIGGRGDDKLYGGPGDDAVLGGAGRDELGGGAGTDQQAQGLTELVYVKSTRDRLLLEVRGACLVTGPAGRLLVEVPRLNTSGWLTVDARGDCPSKPLYFSAGATVLTVTGLEYSCNNEFCFRVSVTEKLLGGRQRVRTVSLDSMWYLSPPLESQQEVSRMS